ncbi:MAG: carbohydrate ABC transporter permease [Treponema sp.]|jgi:putative aldouronate transport system permease protein|nr:carbohydrate ABC transporter permease [Treponema sp.]
MTSKRSLGEKIFGLFNVIGLTALSCVFLLPVWHVLMGSISDPLRLSAYSGLILRPLGKATLGGYTLVMNNSNILRSYLNTIIIVTAATGFGTVLTILAAYALSLKRLYFKAPIVFMITFTMIFNGGLIPTYMVVRNLGMLNSLTSLIIPGAVSVYNIIIMRTAFASIPDALSEAAIIDGAGHGRILTQIIIPVSSATIAVIVLFYAIQHWNAWFNASIYLRDRGLFPLQLTLREIVILSSEQSIQAAQEATDMEIFRPLIKYATIMVATLPMLVIYPFVQKYFVSGVMIGSVKG